MGEKALFYKGLSEILLLKVTFFESYLK